MIVFLHTTAGRYRSLSSVGLSRRRLRVAANSGPGPGPCKKKGDTRSGFWMDDSRYSHDAIVGWCDGLRVWGA